MLLFVVLIHPPLPSFYHLLEVSSNVRLPRPSVFSSAPPLRRIYDVALPLPELYGPLRLPQVSSSEPLALQLFFSLLLLQLLCAWLLLPSRLATGLALLSP